MSAASRNDTTEEEEERVEPNTRSKLMAKRAQSMPKHGKRPKVLHHTMSSNEMPITVKRDATTSEDEQPDVQMAMVKARPLKSRARTVTVKSCRALAPGSNANRSTPTSSGLFHYVRWVVADVLTQDEREALKAKASKATITVGSMCAGMGTEEIVLEGLTRALQEHGALLKHKSIFKAEKDSAKMAFLQKQYPHAGTTFVWDNSDLQKDTVIDVKGQAVQGRLQVDVLFCGIVCKDISPLNTKPKTERAKDGQSGSSLDGLLSYLKCMPLEQRPKLLILECVQRLGHKRQVDPDDRQGTVYIRDELSSLGYCGDWCNVNAKDFFLPQSRPRVYACFLRLSSTNLDHHGHEQRLAESKATFALVERMKVQGPPEPLTTVLLRCKALDKCEPLPKSVPAEAQLASWELPKTELESALVWRQEHCSFAKRLALSDAELKEFHTFANETRGAFKLRAIEGLWLKLMSEQRTRGTDWTKEVMVASIGASLRFMSVRSDIFPCVTPKMTYAILQNKHLRSLSGMEAMALQGIQVAEIKALKLDTTKPNSSLWQDLAGNAFTANILAAFLVAGLLHMM